MKLWKVVALTCLSIIVKGWVQVLQPFLLSIGAVFTALNSDILNLDVQPIEWKNWIHLSEKDEKKETKPKTKTKEESMEELREIFKKTDLNDKLEVVQELLEINKKHTSDFERAEAQREILKEFYKK